MKARLATLTVAATLALSAPPVGATDDTPKAETNVCPSAVVDDFSTGAYTPRPLVAGTQDDTQRGSMLGGRRITRFVVPTAPTNPDNNPYGLTGTLAIKPAGQPLLLVATGYQTFHRLEVFYGRPHPLDADLGCYDRFRIHVAAADVGLNVNLQVLAANNPVVAQCGRNLPGQTSGAGFVAEFPFDCFVPNAGDLPDFGHVNEVRLIVQSASAIAANDYAVSLVELTTGG